MDYKKMYALLLYEVDKALSMIEGDDIRGAYQTLINACNTCEEAYIKNEISIRVTKEILNRVLNYCIANKDSNAYKALRKDYGYDLQDHPWITE